jgi:hypothetical protein
MRQGSTLQGATQLGVSFQTISRDLERFSHDEKTSRPKGGRPKGSKRQPSKDLAEISSQ